MVDSLSRIEELEAPTLAFGHGDPSTRALRRRCAPRANSARPICRISTSTTAHALRRRRRPWSSVPPHRRRADLVLSLAEHYPQLPGLKIAPDPIGFGCSDKPEDTAGTRTTPRRLDHAARRQLGLKDITLVAHDWGGPIGLRFAVENPERRAARHPQHRHRRRSRAEREWVCFRRSCASSAARSTSVGSSRPERRTASTTRRAPPTTRRSRHPNRRPARLRFRNSSPPTPTTPTRLR